MSIPAIQSVLQQMRVAATQSGFAAEAAGPARDAGFAAELKRSLAGISAAQQQADAKAAAFQLGEPGVALNDVMVDLQKASIGLQAGIQVRNRLVAAYQDIMNLPA